MTKNPNPSKSGQFPLSVGSLHLQNENPLGSNPKNIPMLILQIGRRALHQEWQQQQCIAIHQSKGHHLTLCEEIPAFAKSLSTLVVAIPVCTHASNLRSDFKSSIWENSYGSFTIMVGALLVRKPLTFRKVNGCLANQVRINVFRIRISKGCLTNKAPTDIDNYVTVRKINGPSFWQT